MFDFFSSLWSSRNLLLNLVRRDLTVRYKSTVLGFFWSFAKPLAYMGIYHVVFGEILQLSILQPEIPYALHILAGVLPWTFFAGAGSEAMNSILSSANLVKKVHLPLEVFPVAAACSQAIHFALGMIVVVAVMIVFGLVPGPLFVLIPLLAALQFIWVVAVGMLLAALNVFYRDVASIWEVLSAAWFYATPIIYPAYAATDYFASRGWTWATWAYLLNPMAPITIAYRRVLLYGAIEPDAEGSGELALELPDSQLLVSIGITAVLGLGALWFSRWVFMRLARRFADEL